MPASSRSILASLFVALLVGALVVPATRAAAAESAPDGALQVWNLNTHKMHQSDTDYRKFLDYVTDTSNPGVDYWPDVIALQEVEFEGSKPCSTFVEELERRTGQHDYSCIKTKNRGGAAIVYRSGAEGLERVGDKREVTLRINNGQGCEPTDGEDGYRALVQRFRSRQDGTEVNVASVHLPVNNNGDAIDCTWRNSRIVSRAVTGLGAGMDVMAGDWNQPDVDKDPEGPRDWQCWYRGVNKALPSGDCDGVSWKDAVYQQCDGDWDCLQRSWTKETGDDRVRRRIDFLFAHAYSVTNVVTVPWGQVPYSDHRAQGAVLHTRS